MPQITEISNCDNQNPINTTEPEAATQNLSPNTSICGSKEFNATVVDEIIGGNAESSAKETTVKTGEDEAAKEDDPIEGNSVPEYIHADIDEDALKENEKSMTQEELDSNRKRADDLKMKANELFKNNQCEEAIDLYTEALQICPMSCCKERAVLYGNRAASKIKIGSKKSALEDCCKSVEYWPDYVRVLVRRAKLYEHEDKLDDALSDYKRVNELDSGNKDALAAMVRLPPLINERNERLKEEMFGKLKDLGNMILKPFGLSTSNFQMQQDPSTGSYSINFNQNPS